MRVHHPFTLYTDPNGPGAPRPPIEDPPPDMPDEPRPVPPEPGAPPEPIELG